jgi:phage protein D
MAVTSSTPIALTDEAEPFYVPTFQVTLGGEELTSVERDVLRVTYRDSIQEIDSFELVVNNWDAEWQDFKYEPAYAGEPQGLFDPGQQLELRMGYVNNLRLMVQGEITTLEPHFPESGSPTLAIRGLNRLHAFRKKQHTFGWENKRDSEIALDIAQRPEATDRPGLGLGADRIRVADNYLSLEDPETFVFMNNQYDILFLMERARRRNYSVYLEASTTPGKDRLYFGPAQSIRNITYVLEWGRSLIEFQPTLTTHRQVSSVTVRGWDRKSGHAIEGVASLDDRGVNINRDQTAVARAVQGRQEVVTKHPVHSVREAQLLARSLLQRQQEDMIRATGATVGLPDLRAGGKVNIQGIGPRFNGQYYVIDTTHTISDNGYRTTFTARRETDEPVP